ncbi:alpha-ketoglutarate-dependent dioxygenase AlkB [Aquimarina sp. AU119]|uniref:alpha-ketoglutarate-dependent dioxygenase AlkB n=1 Tax=Aquimarina sp. AU119 TaxID=2108528 RepID=UPI000D68BE89|nr:alpha-ketoglutarate-dependent dioxygenase AlkB [Aquimarina sp. AU119]
MNLFQSSINSTNKTTISNIKGLNLLNDFIDIETEKELIQYIDNSKWSNELKRRVQHYGYKYDYKSRSIEPSIKAEPIPKQIMNIYTKLVDSFEGIIKPNQVIVNEYLPGQGIAKHIDCKKSFESVIFSLSLISSCIMKFEKKPNSHELMLNPRSLLILQEDARYNWAHSIPSRKSDKFNFKKYHRERRVSITFRKAIINHKS